MGNLILCSVLPAGIGGVFATLLTVARPLLPPRAVALPLVTSSLGAAVVDGRVISSNMRAAAAAADRVCEAFMM